VEGEPALTREGDQRVLGPSAMDSVNIAPSNVRLDVEELEGVSFLDVATQKTESVRERWDPRMTFGYGGAAASWISR
jgi:hypothetical protein